MSMPMPPTSIPSFPPQPPAPPSAEGQFTPNQPPAFPQQQFPIPKPLGPSEPTPTFGCGEGKTPEFGGKLNTLG
jgi:hypothetical protein